MQSGALPRHESVTTPAHHSDAPRERRLMRSHAERGNEGIDTTLLEKPGMVVDTESISHAKVA